MVHSNVTHAVIGIPAGLLPWGRGRQLSLRAGPGFPRSARAAGRCPGIEPCLGARPSCPGNQWLGSFRSAVHMFFLLVSVSLRTELGLFA